ncbi:MAG: NUDIX domain-containing protein [Candidatus Moraniibacteriota bacterium]
MKNLSVVIGRFQVPELHAGHLYLINYACEKADALLILVGVTQAMPSKRNPLDFVIRKMMLKKAFPKAMIIALPDNPSDARWSDSVDQVIGENFPDYAVSLFGSRDSFIPYYSGKYPVVTVPKMTVPSGTVMRKKVNGAVTADKQFISGIIYAQNKRFPISFQTVDIAVVRHEDQAVLMGRKKIDGEKYRFIGGFVDPADDSLEMAAHRELREEAGPIDCHNFTYLGSWRVSDYRYRAEEDKVMTAFFVTYKLCGRECAGDDIDELAWIPIWDCKKVVIKEHKRLAEELLSHFSSIQ